MKLESLCGILRFRTERLESSLPVGRSGRGCQVNPPGRRTGGTPHACELPWGPTGTCGEAWALLPHGPPGAQRAPLDFPVLCPAEIDLFVPPIRLFDSITGVVTRSTGLSWFRSWHREPLFPLFLICKLAASQSRVDQAKVVMGSF